MKAAQAFHGERVEARQRVNNTPFPSDARLNDHGNFYLGKYAAGSVTKMGNPIDPSEGDNETPSNPIPGSEWAPPVDPELEVMQAQISTYVHAGSIADQLRRKPGIEFDGAKMANAMIEHIADLQKKFAQLQTALTIYRKEPDNQFWKTQLCNLIAELEADPSLRIALAVEKLL